MYDEEMNMDTTYQIGQNEYLNDEGIHDHWDEDQVYVPVEEEPVAGPFSPLSVRLPSHLTLRRELDPRVDGPKSSHSSMAIPGKMEMVLGKEAWILP